MQNTSLTLYVDAQHVSPYAMSCFVALQEKQKEFDLLALDLEAQTNREAHYALTSLTQRVPTLVHGDFSLSESSAIGEYLEEAFPEIAIYPRDMHSRARARQLQAWLRSDLMPIRQERSTEVIFYQATPTPLSSSAEAAVQKLVYFAESLLSDGRAHLFGAWCIADTDLALMINRLAMNGDVVPSQLKDYAARQWERASVQAWVQLSRPPI